LFGEDEGLTPCLGECFVSCLRLVTRVGGREAEEESKARRWQRAGAEPKVVKHQQGQCRGNVID